MLCFYHVSLDGPLKNIVHQLSKQFCITSEKEKEKIDGKCNAFEFVLVIFRWLLPYIGLDQLQAEGVAFLYGYILSDLFYVF